jgi:hypothetical protein
MSPVFPEPESSSLVACLLATRAEFWLDALQAVAVILGGGTAFAGLRTWRREVIGRKMIEVAEEALSAFYSAQDVIGWARSPHGYFGEGRSRPGRDKDEDDVLRERRDSLYVPVERLKRRETVFERLEAAAPRTVVHFGRDAGQAFHKMNEVFNKIHFAAFQLISMAGNTGEPNKRLMDELYKTIYMQYDGTDEIASQVNAAVSRIEDIVLPQLRRSAGAWKRYRFWLRANKNSSTPG